MREMKDSGVEWIGFVPRVWVKKKIKNAVSYIGSGTTPPSHDLLYYDGSIFWIQSGDIYGKNLIFDTSATLTDTAVRAIPALRIYEHDFIVIAMYGGSVGNIAVSKIDACTNQACCVIKPDENNDMQFMYYWILTCRNDFLKSAIGGGQPNISQAKIRNQYYFQPLLSEQRCIASFLDSKCAEINALTADIQEQIATLEQYKRSVITEAVTKGLDPDAEMKDSGVFYMAPINTNWRLTKIGYICKKLFRPFQPEDTALICSNKGKVVIRSDDITGKMVSEDNAMQGINKGDIAIHGMDTWHGAIAFSDFDGKITRVVHVCDSTEDNRFVVYYLQHLAFQGVYKLISNGVRGNTSDFRSWEKVSDIYISLPKTLNEQNRISDYLDNICYEVDEIIRQKVKQLATIEEYKKSFIFEYVTGKKEVGTWK